MSQLSFILSLSVLLIALTGCFGSKPLAASECGKIVAHVGKVLGANAPSQSEMMNKCKAATDEARGCAMAADKPMKLASCKI